MYGSIAQMTAKQGRVDDIKTLTERWGLEHGPNVDGFVASYIFQSDQTPDECWLVAIFENRETYAANANRPEQDAWFQQIRELLDTDPVWHDGEVIYSLLGARPEPTV